jgi:hypothetical protein
VLAFNGLHSVFFILVPPNRSYTHTHTHRRDLYCQKKIPKKIFTKKTQNIKNTKKHLDKKYSPYRQSHPSLEICVTDLHVTDLHRHNLLPGICMGMAAGILLLI